MSPVDKLGAALFECPLIAIIRGVTPDEAESIGEALFARPWPGYLVYVVVPALWYLVYRTRWGLEVRSVGERRPGLSAMSGGSTRAPAGARTPRTCVG